VIKNAKFIFTLDYILNNLPIFKIDHAVAILKMIEDVFEDISTIDVVCPLEQQHACKAVNDLEYGGQYEISDSSDDSDVDDC
jgi:hypothetical protein